MKITFRNLSSEHIELSLKGKKEIIPSQGDFLFETEESGISFCVNPYEKSDITYLFRRAGVILKRSFCTQSAYSGTITCDTVINLYSDKARGKFGDEYRRIVAVSDVTPLFCGAYRVTDEEFVRNELDRSKEKGNRALLVFDIFDILGNALTVLLLLLIPFALIWLFGSFETAYTVCGYLFIPIFAVIVIVNRVFDKYKRKLWYFFKGKALEKSTFKGTDSYFSEDYIREVFSARKN